MAALEEAVGNQPDPHHGTRGAADTASVVLVDVAALIDPTTVAVGDVLVGYPSDSIHANGWSLVRRVLNEFPGEVSADELAAWLKPTRLYHDVTGDLKKSGVKPKARLNSGS